MLTRLCYTLLTLLVLFWNTNRAASAVVVSNATAIKEGVVRYHYYQSQEGGNFRCSTILIIGVGTTMRVEDYDLLAVETVRGGGEGGGQPGLIVTIVDHAPNNPLKLSTHRYTKLVNAIATRTEQVIPICSDKRRTRREEDEGTSQPIRFFLGGHSASGMVAIKSLSLAQGFSPAGVIGLSPFRITDDMMPIVVPSLLWGFSTTTCGVKVGQAADQAYELSSQDQGRVLYQLQNPSGQPSHCIFANHGCIPVCPPGPNDSTKYAWIRSAVGESIHHFLQAIESNNFTRKALDLTQVPCDVKQAQLRMFVNQDDVPKPPNSFSTVVGAKDNQSQSQGEDKYATMALQK